MDPLPHKEIVLPEVDLSQDKPYPEWMTRDQPPRPDGSRHSRWNRSWRQYSHGWDITRGAWEKASREYEVAPGDFYACWYYLDGHPIFWKFRVPSAGDSRPRNHYAFLEHDQAFARMSIDVHVARVEEDERGRTEIWLEAGKWSLFEQEEHGVRYHSHVHDYELDCGAPTFEEAIIKLARLVWDRYGNDRLIADAPREPATSG